MRREDCSVAQQQAEAGPKIAHVCVAFLQSCSGAPLIAQVVGRQAHLELRCSVEDGLAEEDVVAGVGVDVNWPAQRCRDDRVAVRGIVIRCEEKPHAPAAHGGERLRSRRPIIATERAHVESVLPRIDGDEIDHAAHRPVAPYSRRSSSNDLDLPNERKGNTRPVHPARERFVHGNAIE